MSIAAGRELLDLTPAPTALIGFSDPHRGRDVARRPGGWVGSAREVAIAGFDGVDLPWLSGERLTTVNQRRDRGAVAAQAALALANGTSGPDLDVELVIGTTT